jgi:hypothetical protein
MGAYGCLKKVADYGNLLGLFCHYELEHGIAVLGVSKSYAPNNATH